MFGTYHYAFVPVKGLTRFPTTQPLHLRTCPPLIMVGVARLRPLVLLAVTTTWLTANFAAGEYAGFPTRAFSVQVVAKTGTGATVEKQQPQTVFVNADGTKLAAKSANLRTVVHYEDDDNDYTNTFYTDANEKGDTCKTGHAPGSLGQLVVAPDAAAKATFDGIVPCGDDADAEAVKAAGSMCTSYVGFGSIRLSVLGRLARNIPFRVISAAAIPVKLELPTLNVTVLYKKWVRQDPPSSDFDHPSADSCKVEDVCLPCSTLPTLYCFVPKFLARIVGHGCLCNPLVAFAALASVGVGFAAAIRSVQAERHALAIAFVLYACMMLLGGVTHSAFKVECGLQPATQLYQVALKLVMGMTSAVAVSLAYAGLVDAGLLPDAGPSGKNFLCIIVLSVMASISAAMTASNPVNYFNFVVGGCGTYIIAQIVRWARARRMRGFTWLFIAGAFGFVGFSAMILPPISCFACFATKSLGGVQATWYWFSTFSMASLAMYEEAARREDHTSAFFTQIMRDFDDLLLPLLT